MKLAERNGLKAREAPPTTRVAIYVRQSIDRGDKDLTSCQAQRQVVEAYITSQRAEGWAALPDTYEDSGFSGGTTDRPAFQRLMRDIEAGNVDAVVVYRFDRLSRSLLDFASLLQTFDRHGVRFVSVTQQIDTSSSTGRLMVNLLATFAEFEREQIRERIRDKAEATRRKGLWGPGGSPYGYQAKKGRLHLVEDEATIVRLVFELYADLASMSEVASELNRRGIRARKGRMWSKRIIARILGSVVVTGRVPYGDETFPGQHEAIIDQETWDAAQAMLRANRRDRGSSTRNKHNRLLKGLLFCARCGGAMTTTYSMRGPKKWFAYVCQSKHLRQDDACPKSRVPAPDIEGFVVEQIKAIGRDPKIVEHAIEEAARQAKERVPELEAERRRLGDEVRKVNAEREALLEAIVAAPGAAHALGERLAKEDERLGLLEERLREVQNELVAIETSKVQEDGLGTALSDFDDVWDYLVMKERIQLIQLVVERVEYDGESGEVAVHTRIGADS